ncbi:MAG: hypothetical protein HZB16_07310 [Armatimonadetes bacterium]|nr:hypothetical protein [Armatimonadota bacterium]
MAQLTTEAINRLTPGRTMDIHVAEEVMGQKAHPLEPFVAPKYSTDEALAQSVLDKLKPFMAAGFRLDERDARAGYRVDYSDVQAGTILLEATATTRAAAICKFALHFVAHHPEARG